MVMIDVVRGGVTKDYWGGEVPLYDMLNISLQYRQPLPPQMFVHTTLLKKCKMLFVYPSFILFVRVVVPTK